ncbi:hypothetical protein N1I86_07465 [Bacillus sp. FSL W8-0116]|uniref:hypothetical protein n=1 Tax=Bacillus sp. FSL W8-0116 TaxID=2978206 RepID=UPI0030F9D0B9
MQYRCLPFSFLAHSNFGYCWVDRSKKSNEYVLQNVESISAVVEETAAGSEEISASTQEQKNSISKMVEKVSSLRELTESLNATMSQFKLKE